MLGNILGFSLRNKLMVLLFTGTIAGFGLYSLTQIPIGAVPDITNNQVQVITTSRNLSTLDVEQFLTYPVELEMANLPGVKEIRSVSKFGLSVVTVVFEERMGTYLPRQLLAEKLKSAAEKIPEGFGVPEMGPITTGLGEVYQYILDTKPGYDSLYSPMELRTIQDWIVKRQLSGIPGVVEVNTWGGYLKQYEVSVDPDRLQAMGVTLGELFDALEKSNSIAGGGYIEKKNQSYFIRGEGLATSRDDLRNTVITLRNGIPVLVGDVARVGFGHATRFGAITGNGEGEKVLGQVMMLKNANSKQVIRDVKKRVEEIGESLPPGVYINPFLERSFLIGKTTKTVAENLVLGFLIVAFVVILLIGDWRSGLVVATVIPLCLLFAISLMYIFGIDANLMSLGAIDFGIIIDGAVIIVEFIAASIAVRSAAILALEIPDQQSEIDRITNDSSLRMLHSAVFGQLIILIVFIPVLSLTGVEGKMFRPMALTFCFAVLGALFFCLTYVPVMSSLFLKPRRVKDKNLSAALIGFLHRMYEPVLRFSMQFKGLVLTTTAVVFILTLVLFGRMGGEFIPTLDEGDFVIQPVLPTGMSLSKTIEVTTAIEKILKQFPEVEQVVSRIGAAEVPTDPMSMEESDIIVTLKPIRQWTTASTKDELADKFKEALHVLPGFEPEFTQPIEMRFNELITGVRADVAVKIYGDDLAVLAEKGEELKTLIEGVEGASDVTVEKVEGLPQMQVVYNREKLARYGLTVADANRIISMGFAGSLAGTLFEGEKRFDLVVRLAETARRDLESLRNLQVPLPGGGQVTLREVADIRYAFGPAKISRDQTKRHIVVGINVRNRDMESVVDDIQMLVNQDFSLPSGYSLTYGGQYQNLRNAKNRLMLAVPVALLLIFILLHFAFRSIRDAALIFSAIPLSAVGGVLLLWLRGMPFSISAGVGFIALFGIAVLNGIVLVEHLKELKTSGLSDLRERIFTGTRQRLRPVVMTAAAAALGFLPMAVSSSAGAEVQRPLATVVIGGLVTSTLLTMIIIPLFYLLFEQPPRFRKKTLNKGVILFLTGLLFLPSVTRGQSKLLTPAAAIEIALSNNPDIQAERLRLRQTETLRATGFDPGKTSFFFNYDENNIAANGLPIKVWGVSQSFRFPTVYGIQQKALRNEALIAGARLELLQRDLSRQVLLTYDELLILEEKRKLLAAMDSLVEQMVRGTALKVETGEAPLLEMLMAESGQAVMQNRQADMENRLMAAHSSLAQLLGSPVPFLMPEGLPVRAPARDYSTDSPAGTFLYQFYEASAANAVSLGKSNLLPDVSLEYFQGTNKAPGSPIYRGFQAGLEIPLFYGGHKARIHAARAGEEISRIGREQYIRQTRTRAESLLRERDRLALALDRYEQQGRQLTGELIRTALLEIARGESSLYNYLRALESSMELTFSYLDQLQEYNAAVYELENLFVPSAPANEP